MSASSTSASPSVPWWKEPTRDQWYAYIAAWLGWTLDAFDFTIFFFILKPIAAEFNVPLTAVAFIATGPWVKPWRTADATSSSDVISAVILMVIAIAVIVGAYLLASRNLRQGRGDRDGARRLAAWTTGVLLALWVCQVHVAPDLGFLAMFLLAIVTSVFNGLLVWTMYVALEPFVVQDAKHLLPGQPFQGPHGLVAHGGG